jgi:hypothetical protein
MPELVDHDQTWLFCCEEIVGNVTREHNHEHDSDDVGTYACCCVDIWEDWLLDTATEHIKGKYAHAQVD